MKGNSLVRAALLTLLVLAAGAAPAASQTDLAPGTGLEETPRVGIGYVANAPDILTGVAGYVAFDVLGGLGLYVDVKADLATPADEPDFLGLTVDEVEATPGQRFRRDESGWWGVNLAVVRPLSPELMVYLGAGYMYEDVYSRYRDVPNVIEEALLGWYWIRDEEVSGGTLNVLGGGFFRLGRSVALQFGVESKPFGATVGLSYSAPLR